MSSNIQIPKKCQHCGKMFVARTTVTKFCGHSCASKNYKKGAKEDKIQEALIASFNNWKGELEQVDDVCLIGVRI